MSFAALEKNTARRLGETDLYLVTGGSNAMGLPVWHYVRVPSARRAAFMRAMVSGDIVLTQFGEIVLAGYGVAPPAHIEQKMRADKK